MLDFKTYLNKKELWENIQRTSEGRIIIET